MLTSVASSTLTAIFPLFFFFSWVTTSILLPNFGSTLKKPQLWNPVAFGHLNTAVRWSSTWRMGGISDGRRAEGPFSLSVKGFSHLSQNLSTYCLRSHHIHSHRSLSADRSAGARIVIPIRQWNCAQAACPINQGAIAQGERRRRWRPCADCKEQWLLITVTDGVKKHQPPPTNPPLRKILYFISANMRMCVCVLWGASLSFNHAPVGRNCQSKWACPTWRN